MSRRISLLLLSLLLLAAAGLQPGHRAAADGAFATVTPEAGDLSTAFTFSVTGMTPGHAVSIVLFDSAGNRYTFQRDGVDQAIVIADDGTAAVQVRAATDLPGAVPGTWQVVFTEDETGYVATIPFDVSP
jgi:hypothetical protein